ncbi:MAG: hypothetical protein ACRD2C_28195 [Acidimicrobiales bacterium]
MQTGEIVGRFDHRDLGIAGVILVLAAGPHLGLDMVLWAAGTFLSLAATICQG